MAYQFWNNFRFGTNHITNYTLVWCQKENAFQHLLMRLSKSSPPEEPAVKRAWNGTAREMQDLKRRSTTELHPILWKGKMCTLLLLSNLAYPEWLAVHCNKTLTPNVLCVKQEHTILNGFTSVSQGCFKFHVVQQGKCFYFTPATKDKRTNAMKNFIVENSWNVKLPDLKEVHSKEQFCALLQAVGIIPQYIRGDRIGRGTTNYLQISEDFTIFHTNSSEHPVANNIFCCANNSYIASKNVCDGILDCADSSDETHCIYFNITENLACKYLKSNKTQNVCGPLFFLSSKNSCSVYEQFDFGRKQVSPNTRSKTKTTFLCAKIGIQISYCQVNDLVSDCGPDSEDESILKTLLVNNSKVLCSNPGQVPCRLGHSKCYAVSDICTYTIDKDNNLSPCRTGTHLEDCTQFECHMKYKCPAFYCIHWSYVCNGKWDCPFGLDEDKTLVCKDHKYCNQLYKCKIHPGVFIWVMFVTK